MKMKSLTIGHLAKEPGVNLETVRYYERQGFAAKATAQRVWLSPLPYGCSASAEIHSTCTGARVFTQGNPRTLIASSVTHDHE
jgi:hypothetical protein